MPSEEAYNQALRYHGPPLKKRTLNEFIAWQKRHRRDPFAPVPIYPNVAPSADIVWESIADFVNYLRNTPGTHYTMAHYTESSLGARGERVERLGDYDHSIDSLIALYDRGWAEGVNLVRRHMDDAVLAATKAALEVQDMVRDVHGAIIDIPSFLRGEPECQYEFQDTVQEVLFLEVDVDYFYGGSLKSEDYMHRGVAIMSAVMALRRLGVFVDLYAREISQANTHAGGHGRHSCTIRMMKPGVPENMSEVMLAVAHPDFNMPFFYVAQSMAWGCREGTGICYQDRDVDDFYPTPGSGKVSIPGVFNHNLDDLLDWANIWSTPQASAHLVKLMLKCAAPRQR